MSSQVYDSGFGYTCLLLLEWGRACRDPEHGYPQSSSHVPKARGGVRQLPPLVLLIDHIISDIAQQPEERDHASLLRKHYLERSTLRERLNRLGIGWHRYQDKLSEARWSVHIRLGA